MKAKQLLIFVSVFMAGILDAQDWTITSLNSYSKDQLPEGGKLVLDPNNQQRQAWVISQAAVRAPDREKGRAPGFYLSEDGGKTWHNKNSNLNFGDCLAHPRDGRFIAIIVGEPLRTDEDGNLYPGIEGRLAVSKDGDDWKDLVSNPPEGFSPSYGELLIDPVNPEGIIIFLPGMNIIGTDWSIWKPSEDFQEWDHITSKDPGDYKKHVGKRGLRR